MSTLKELKALGAFISDAPIKKEIKFKLDGDEELSAVIHIKRLSIGDYETVYLTDPKEDRSRTANVISKSIMLGEEGKERLSFEDAYRLHPRIATAMIEAFNEVNLQKKS